MNATGKKAMSDSDSRAYEGASPGRPETRKPGVLHKTTAEDEVRMQAQMDKYLRERTGYAATLPTIRAAGLEALKRLLHIAQGNSGQCRHVAAFLLGLYNGNRFKFDLTDFRCLDRAIFNDCMAVLAMDYQPQQEVHSYFDQGNDEGRQIWEALAKRWGVRDYMQDV